MFKRLIATPGRTFQRVQSIVYSFAVKRLTSVQLMVFILANGLKMHPARIELATISVLGWASGCFCVESGFFRVRGPAEKTLRGYGFFWRHSFLVCFRLNRVFFGVGCRAFFAWSLPAGFFGVKPGFFGVGSDSYP